MGRGKRAQMDKPREIQGSVRPDGSVRKSIKIRPGYTPPDEVKAFRTRGSQFREAKNSSTLPTVNMGAEPSGGAAQLTKAQKKNASKKRAKENAAAADPEPAP